MLTIVFSNIVLFSIYFIIQSSYRLQLYVNAIEILYNALETKQTIPSVLLGQMPNIYPIWDRFNEIRDYNILPTLFGTGFGSASILNNQYILTQEVLNPHANAIRLFYENGVIGTLFFLLAFIKPIKNFSLPQKFIDKIITMILIMMGCYFGHRSSTLYILFGVMLSINYIYNHQKINKEIFHESRN